MPSMYTGLYRISTEVSLTDIDVFALGGHSISLPISDYISLSASLPWRNLPTNKQNQVVLAINRLNEGCSEVIWC